MPNEQELLRNQRKAAGKKGRPLKLSAYTSATTHTDPQYKHEAIRKLYEKTINLPKPKGRYLRDRLAKRTPLQKAAAQQVQDLIANQKRLNIPQKAQQNLAQAQQQNIMQAVQPYLNQSVDPLDLRQHYLNPYQNQMIQTLRDESKQHLLEDILPKVNASYIKGFHSSGRNKFTQKVIDNEQRNLQREIVKLLSHGYEKSSEQGLQHARLKSEENLNKGQLAGSIASRQKESDIIGAREMQNLNQIAVSQEHQNAQALNQIGSEEQRQNQSELNVPYQQFLEDREKPYLHLSRQAALLGGLPQPGFQTFQTTPPSVDVPPNLYSAGAGALGIASDLMHPRRARGGSVKAPKRAAGGPVQAPDTAQMQAMAQQFQQPGRDPRWGYLGAMGSTMLANSHINPLRALGMGALAGQQSMNNEYAEQDQRAVHAANLMDKINHTRQIQQEMLQQYDLGKERNLLTRRGQDMTHQYDQASLAERSEKPTKRSKPLVIEGKPYNVMQDPNTGESLLQPLKIAGPEGQQEELISKDRQKRIDESWNKIRSVQNYIDSAKKVQNYSSKVDSGPVSGTLAEWVPGVGQYAAGLLTNSTPENIAGLDTSSNELALAGRDLGEKGGRSVQELQTRLRSKPGVSRDPSTNITGSTQAQYAGLNDLKEELDHLEHIGSNKDKQEVQAIKKFYLDKHGIDLNTHERKTFEEIQEEVSKKLNQKPTATKASTSKKVHIPKELKKMSKAQLDHLLEVTP